MSNKSILIVDDEEYMLFYLDLLFQKHGYEVYTASDGAQALKIAEVTHPKVVLLDIKMPNMNGIDFLIQFRKNPLFTLTPVIVLSARDQLYQIREGMAAGATEYLCKPIPNKEIFKKVNYCLENT